MVTLHEVITFLVSMQISISSLQTHNVNRCGRSRHLARKLSRSEERFSRNAETDIVCRLLLEKKNRGVVDRRRQRLDRNIDQQTDRIFRVLRECTFVFEMDRVSQPLSESAVSLFY